MNNNKYNYTFFEFFSIYIEKFYSKYYRFFFIYLIFDWIKYKYLNTYKYLNILILIFNTYDSSYLTKYIYFVFDILNNILGGILLLSNNDLYILEIEFPTLYKFYQIFVKFHFYVYKIIVFIFLEIYFYIYKLPLEVIFLLFYFLNFVYYSIIFQHLILYFLFFYNNFIEIHIQIIKYFKYYILFGLLMLFLILFFGFFPKKLILKLLCLPILAICNLLLIKKTNFKYLKLCSIFWSFFIFNCILLIVYFLVNCNKNLYNSKNFYLLKYYFDFNGSPILYGLDSISLLFILLTAFLFIIVFLALMNIEMVDLKKYLIIIFILYFFLLNVFLVQNLFFFFFFFESVVFPMFFIILMGGSRFQKTKAAYYFFFFTVIGSLFMFISINYLLLQFGTVNFNKLIFYMSELSIIEQRLIWLSFFLSFAIKIPMFPFHTWLPEAHVEAPTIGSVLLAGILLKLGCYGFIRISFFLLPEANIYFSPYIYVLCLISIIYSCIIAIRQTDIKRIIAYASIAHMNLIVLGLFSFTSVGIYGAIFQSISHGLVSSALFLLVGMLYSRYKSRLITYYSGLTQVMPLFSFFFLSFILANISFPLTSNFMGELLLFIGISKLHFGLLIVSLFSIILNSIYSLWFCNRILYGNVKSHLLLKFQDLTYLEIFILSILFLSVLVLGIFPNIIGNIPVFYKFSLIYELKTLALIHSLYL